MGEHILNRRARFWLAMCDAIDRLHLPVSWWRWSLARAGKAVNTQADKTHPDERWRII